MTVDLSTAVFGPAVFHFEDHINLKLFMKKPAALFAAGLISCIDCPLRREG